MSIYGTLDGVFAARQQLLGCLPLVLMFDLPDENGRSIRDGENFYQFILIHTYLCIIHVKLGYLMRDEITCLWKMVRHDNKCDRILCNPVFQ